MQKHALINTFLFITSVCPRADAGENLVTNVGRLLMVIGEKRLDEHKRRIFGETEDSIDGTLDRRFVGRRRRRSIKSVIVGGTPATARLIVSLHLA